MTHEEAIKILMGYNHTPQERAALETLIPELAESEDERIRKAIIDLINATGVVNLNYSHKQMIAWLEKQKDASKAIEAVEKIDKYIDEHLANAHDMKDSNPDKKYYRGWDDALGKMSGILQDVYSDEKQKEPTFISDLPPDDKGEPGENGILEKQKESLRDFIDDFPYSDQKEQKPAEPSDEELVRHPPIAYTYPSDASRDEQLKMALLALLNSDLIKVAGNKFTKQDLIDWVEKQQEQKPAEWSEADEIKLQKCIKIVERWEEDYDIAYAPYSCMLKSLPLRCPKSSDNWKPSEVCYGAKGDPDPAGVWKPSEEQIHAIIEALKYLPNNKDEWMVLNTLADVLRKLI